LPTYPLLKYNNTQDRSEKRPGIKDDDRIGHRGIDKCGKEEDHPDGIDHGSGKHRFRLSPEDVSLTSQ